MTIHIFGDSYADPMPHEQENAWYDMLDEEVLNYGKRASGPAYSLSLLTTSLHLHSRELDSDVKKVVFFLSSKYRIPASFSKGIESEVALKHIEKYRKKESKTGEFGEHKINMKWGYEYDILFDSVKETFAFSVYRDLSFLRFLSDFYKIQMICFILHEKSPSFWNFINSLNSENYFIYPKNFHEEVSSKQGVSNVFLRNHLLYKNHIILSDIIKKFFNNDRNFPEFFTVDQIIDEPYIYE
jgi:hypothetical protein